MPKYMISFNDGDMTFPEEDLPEVAFDAHAVMHEAQAAGVWIFGGGFMEYDVHTVTAEGSVTDQRLSAGGAHLGGFCIIDVPSKEEAFMWAAKTAKACRCAQEVREFMDDPEA